MFEKWTKKFASKATDHVIDGAAQSLNERINQYGDIIQIGLVLGVIVLGSRHIMRRNDRNPPQTYLPGSYIPGGQPVIVNNYYREREEKTYERKQRNYIQNGQLQTRPPQKTHSKR